MPPPSPIEPPHLLAGLVGDVEARAFSLVLSITAAAIALVSVAYAIYAGLGAWLVKPAAAAVTSAIFALLTVAIGLIGRNVIERRAQKARAQAQAARLARKPSLGQAAFSLALAAASRIGEAAIRRRLIGR